MQGPLFAAPPLCDAALRTAPLWLRHVLHGAQVFSQAASDSTFLCAAYPWLLYGSWEGAVARKTLAGK